MLQVMGQGELSLPPVGSMLVPNPYTHNPEPSFPPVLCVRNLRGGHISFRRQEKQQRDFPDNHKGPSTTQAFFSFGCRGQEKQHDQDGHFFYNHPERGAYSAA